MHQFIKTGEVDKTPIQEESPTALRVRPIHGIKVVCANCGEVRDLFEDGEIRYKHQPAIPCQSSQS